MGCTAVISSTYDHKYFFYIPIVTWLWNKIGCKTHLILPDYKFHPDIKKYQYDIISGESDQNTIQFFTCDHEYEPTYTQCSRLYAASDSRIQDDELLITSDIDMAVFGLKHYHNRDDSFNIVGYDLTPPKQYPICYIEAKASSWRKLFTHDRDLDTCLHDLLFAHHCENMRGNYWAKDQEEAYNRINQPGIKKVLITRSNGENQFALNRVDRDDLHYKDRWDNIIDAHLWRPGYEASNFDKILELINKYYPTDNLQWMIDYRNEYVNRLIL